MKQNVIKFRLSLLLVFLAGVLLGQTGQINNPYITNFTKSHYKGGIENWDVVTSKEGYIYAANNEGLLKYDGYLWKLYKLPNKTIVRSVALDTLTGRIYVGGQDELGYFYPDQKGVLNYQSLKNLLPEGFTSLEDVWDIQTAGKNLIFRSVNNILLYDHSTIKVLTTNSNVINYLKYINNVIYFGDPSKGIFKLVNEELNLIKGSELFINQKISDIISFDENTLLFISERKGMFLYDGIQFKLFTQKEGIASSILTSVVQLNQHVFVVGSVLGGIKFFDRSGNLIYSLSKGEGLQTNSIINLALDFNGNIWAGTTNGIDQILINSPYSILYPDDDLQGGAYAVKIFKNKLYIGTNNGLFCAEWPPVIGGSSKKSFKKVKNSEGQVWALDIVGEELFLGHNEGAFRIVGEEAFRLHNDFIGTWRFIELPDKNRMITGTYLGLQLFVKEGNHWRFESIIDGFKESSRIITKDNQGDIWVSHPYRGVYRLTLTNDYKSIKKLKNYGENNGLPSNLSNYVTRIKDKIYVNGETGIYVFDALKDVFKLDQNLTGLMGEKINVRRLFQENDENIWFVNENDCGVIVIEDSPLSKKVSKKSTPFLNGKLIGGFENIYAPDPASVFVCTDKGVILIDSEKLKNTGKLELRFLEIRHGQNDSILFGGHGAEAVPVGEIPYTQNRLFITFGTNQLDRTNEILYSIKIEGLDKEWSEWSGNNFKELINMSPGKYTFRVKAKASYDAASAEIFFEFKIKSPWYASPWAILGYLILFLAALLFLIKYLEKKHETEKIVLKMEKEESEAMVEILQNEKLQSEILFKNRELALSTMHIVQKNETLSKLREELGGIIKQSKEYETKSNLKKVISILSDDQRLEEDWDSFALHFDQVHTDFLKRLKSEYPQLSPKDLKLCAYLRMNLTTKDIAPLLNISVRGVEISRYRLRKKMGISGNENLNEMMMDF